MYLSRNRHGFSHWGRLALASVAAAVLLSGCGGGGGGGGSTNGGSTSGGSTNGGGGGSTATVTGHLIDRTTTNVLPNRTVTVVGLGLSGVSNSNGDFAINSVPVTSITLSIADSNGTANGTDGPINLSNVGGSPKSLGTIILDVSSSTGPPPPPGTGG